MSMSADTVLWWLSNDDKAIKRIAGAEFMQLLHGIEYIESVLQRADVVWSHSTFDPVIIMENFRIADIDMDFSHKIFKDLRTLEWLTNTDPYDMCIDEFVIHSAADDCIRQIKWAAPAIKKCTDLWRKK